jgi:anti-anti-sigma factor
VSELAQVELLAQNGVSVALVSGEIDLSNADATFSILKRAADNAHGGLVLDLSKLEYLDSAGVRLLFTLARFVRRNGGNLRAVVPRGARIRRVLELADAEQMMGLDETASDAVERVSSL